MQIWNANYFILPFKTCLLTGRREYFDFQFSFENPKFSPNNYTKQIFFQEGEKSNKLQTIFLKEIKYGKISFYKKKDKKNSKEYSILFSNFPLKNRKI